MVEERKGIQLSQAFGAVLTIVLVAVLVIVAILLFVNLNSSFDNTSSSSTGVNETLADMDEIGVQLNAELTNCSASNYVITTMSNTSGAVAAGNYTISPTGLITFTSEDSGDISGLNDTDWQTTYSWKWGGAACEATEELIIQFGTYPALIGLVGTIIFLGLVIGVLVASFVFGGQGRKV